MLLTEYLRHRARGARRLVHDGSVLAAVLDDVIEFFNRFPEEGLMAERDKGGRQVPAIARNVHYLARGSADGVFAVAEPRAAIITDVDEPGNPESAVSLAVFNPSGLFFNHHVPYGDGPGCWRWPPYVPPVAGAPPRASTGESVAAGGGASGAAGAGDGGAGASGEAPPRSLGAAAGTPTLREWLTRVRDFRIATPPARFYANSLLQLLEHADALRTARDAPGVLDRREYGEVLDRVDLLLGHLDAVREVERTAGCYVSDEVEAAAVALGAEPRDTVLRQFAPLDPLNPAVGLPCLRCHAPFKAGDRTMLIEDPQGEHLRAPGPGVACRVEAILVHIDCEPLIHEPQAAFYPRSRYGSRYDGVELPVTHALGQDARAAAAEHARKLAGLTTDTPAPLRLHLDDGEKNP